MDLAKEKLDDYGEDPKEEVVDEVVHGSQFLLLSTSFRRHGGYEAETCSRGARCVYAEQQGSNCLRR